MHHRLFYKAGHSRNVNFSNFEYIKTCSLCFISAKTNYLLVLREYYLYAESHNKDIVKREIF